MHVRLPFQAQWVPRILDGSKTTTCRTKRFGGAGDTFDVDDVVFRLTEVTQMPLTRARDTLFEQEGFASPEAFQSEWEKNHPTRGFDPGTQVWVHRFTPAAP